MTRIRTFEMVFVVFKSSEIFQASKTEPNVGSANVVTFGMTQQKFLVAVIFNVLNGVKRDATTATQVAVAIHFIQSERLTS